MKGVDLVALEPVRRLARGGRQGVQGHDLDLQPAG